MWLETHLSEAFGLSKEQQKNFFFFCKDVYEVSFTSTDDVEELDEDEIEELFEEFKGVSLETEDKFWKES